MPYRLRNYEVTNREFSNRPCQSNCRTMSQPPSPLFRSVLLVAAGAVAGMLGTLAVQRRTGSQFSGAAVSATGPQVSPARNPALNRRAGDEAIKLGQILAADDREHKSTDLRRLGEVSAADGERDALSLAGTINSDSDRADFMRGVVEGMAGRDPQAAANFALTEIHAGALQADALRIALAKWGATNPRDAYAWANEHLNGPVKDEAVNALVQSWAARSPEAAAAWFEETRSTSQPLLAALLGGWAAKSPRNAAQWVETLPDAVNRDTGRVIAAREWAAQNPEEAAGYYQKPAPGLAGVLADIWGSSNPAAAAKWINKLPAGPAREEAAGTLATVWAASDINAAVKWSAGLTDPAVRGAAVEHLATTWGAIDPDKAIAWLDTQPAALRDRGLAGAYNSWAGTDPAGLQDWITQLPAGAPSDTARRSLGDVWSASDPAAALNLALGMSPGTQPDTAGRYFRVWRRSDDAGAQEWLEQNRESLSDATRARLEKEQERTVR